jgi:hypothetical protein
MDGDQDDPASGGTTKARLKKMDERHVNLTKSDSFDFQSYPLGVP